jgi:hypothetical protein
MAARSGKVDRALAELESLREGAHGPATEAALRRAFARDGAVVVAKAADVAAELELAGLCGPMEEAFPRFLVDPAKRDRQCQAKRAIVRALVHLSAPAEEVYRIAARHVQLEPVWGGSEDTAAELRGVAVVGLVQARAADALIVAADLLGDPKPAARAGAVRALLCSSRIDTTVPLLHLKIRSGDDDPRVTAECLAALVELAPDDGVPFAASYLDDGDPAIAEGAALALAQARSPAALAHLRDLVEREVDPERLGTALVAIAMLRIDPALEYLVDATSEGDLPIAHAALRALSLYNADARLSARIAAVVEARDDPALRRLFAERFEAD